MILITSAAYIGPEFRSELGKIPPAFLPIGNQRLYRYQYESLNTQDKVVLTIPESFSIPKRDLRQLEQMSIEILEIPEGLSLGDSIVCALNLSGYSEGPLTILHGDTLVYDVPVELHDIIAVSEVEDNYEWATFDGKTVQDFHPYDGATQANKQVVNGYFRFSDARTFIQSMVRARGAFIEGINLYSQQCKLSSYLTKDWHDFGHLHTYFRSKTHVSTARAFNSLKVESGVVTKRSDMPNKMAAESHWFQNIPSELKRHTPNFLGELSAGQRVEGYRIEYQCISSLNELFVFGDLPVFVWDKILKACGHFVSLCSTFEATESTQSFKTFLLEKTDKRLAEFSNDTGIALDEPWTLNGVNMPSIKHIHETSARHIPNTEVHTVVHGDFCFSNILYDFRSQSIKVIDPRGMNNEGLLSIHGFAHYDIAKLAHSIIGKYDFIIAGYFDLSRDGNALAFEVYQTDKDSFIRERFETLCEQQFGLNANQLLAMQVQLFLSMLPLHADKPERQLALLANAMKLYAELSA